MAKKQWVIASIIGWQTVSLILLGVITHQLWQNDYHLTFSRIVIIFTSWASILFVMWYIADLFDHSAGFERWLRAFNSRARVTPMPTPWNAWPMRWTWRAATRKCCATSRK